MITLTEAAAKKIGELQTQNNSEDKVLRVFVSSGGCSGLEYGMSFAPIKDGDQKVESQGVQFYVDAKSTDKLKDSTIDFDDGLHGKGFMFNNPQAQSTCGCGKSFN